MLTTQQLLEHVDEYKLISLIAAAWTNLLDEEEQELCLENIYDLLAQTAPKPDNFSLLTNDEKAQHEIDIDMLLITIDFKEIGAVIFKSEENKTYLWSLVGNNNDKTNKKIFAKLFS